MDPEEIAKIVELVVERLWQKLIQAAPKRNVLMLFSGASTGYMVGMQSIRMLSQGGHTLTVAMTDSACKVIGVDHVREAGASQILTSEAWVSTPKLVRETDLVLVPTLSMNTAAHLALGLMDSMFTTLVLGALLGGKPVVAICDGANPYGNGGKVFSDQNVGSPELRKKLADHLMTLASYGVDLVGEQDYLRSMILHLISEGAIQPAPAPVVVPAQTNGNGHSNGNGHTKKVYIHSSVLTVEDHSNGNGHTKKVYIHSSVLTVEDLANCERGAHIYVQPNARLTPLAQETIGRMQLKVFYEV